MTTIYGGDPIRLDPGNSPTVRFALTDEAKAAGLPYPERKHDSDAGFDLRAFGVAAPEGKPVLVITGVRVSIPPGYCGLVKERSSWAQEGLQIAAGIIDSGYTGEIVVVCPAFPMDKLRREEVDSEAQSPRFAQLLIVPIWQGGVEYVDSLDETERGAGGFGSTFHD